VAHDRELPSLSKVSVILQTGANAMNILDTLCLDFFGLGLKKKLARLTSFQEVSTLAQDALHSISTRCPSVHQVNSDPQVCATKEGGRADDGE